MICFPNAKINLGLNIIERRADGYHNLETLFYPIPLEDALEIVPCKEGMNDCTIRLYGDAIQGDSEENLVVKAYRMMAAYYPLPKVAIHLYKKIPMGAGMGGGSADGAFALMMLSSLSSTPLSNAELLEYATRLGADCPFFLANKPSFACGIGELLSPADCTLKGRFVAVVKPPLHISTREAFAHIKPRKPLHSVKEIVSRPMEKWRGELLNDFEESLFPSYPLLPQIKEELYRQGAVYASMSGSGSALYGIFNEKIHEESLQSAFPGCFTASLEL